MSKTPSSSRISAASSTVVPHTTSPVARPQPPNSPNHT
jgi:hypothetical protein